jgi:hypothetical protein
MRKTNYLYSLIVSSLAMVLLAGCSSNPASPPTTALPVTAPAPPAATPQITGTNVYVVQAGRDPISTLVFPVTAGSGSTPSQEIPGSQVSVDGAGNIYVLDQKSYPSFAVTGINVYAPDLPVGKPVRSLPVGPGTKISAVHAMTVSAAGEIFVNDGTGIAVFGPTATGDADPVRYIKDIGEGPSAAIKWSGYMVVDGSGNLYVGNNGEQPIVVFGPKDTGPVAPSRGISGPLTHLGKVGCAGGYAMFGIAVDSSEDVYVLYRCQMAPGALSEPLTVFEFDPTANGNVAPIRSVTAPGLGLGYSGTGLAVDSAGTIYVSAGDGNAATGYGPVVVEFSASASGTVTPSNILASSAWSFITPPPGEDEWFDPSGTIAVR